jgi:hypothetical protein
MRLRLQRKQFTEDYTMGRLFLDGVFLCDTVEDKVRDYNADGDLQDPGEEKVYGETAIPYGRYNMDLTMSPKFKRLLPLIMDVPEFTGIRIHRGNTAKDSAGCPLPGEKRGEGRVVNSTKYELIIVERMLKAIRNGEDMTIEITNNV